MQKMNNLKQVAFGKHFIEDNTEESSEPLIRTPKNYKNLSLSGFCLKLEGIISMHPLLFLSQLNPKFFNFEVTSQKLNSRAMKYMEMIPHFSHPQHKLKFEYTEAPFKCDGCKEVGIGSCYKCGICDYDLHLHCAVPSPSIYHPFYTKCSFQFMSRPPGGYGARYCSACQKDVTGFVYHCKACGYDLHPCCAKLPMVLDDGEAKLLLYRKVSALCHRCGRKGRSWTYRSTCKRYNLHVSCVKEMLVENWHEIYISGCYGAKRKLETRIPSLKDTLQAAHHRNRRKGKVKKCCEMAGLAMQFVISAVLGDPTSLIAGVIGYFMSR